MKIDQEYVFGIITIIVGVIGLPLWFISYIATREAEISRKITSALNLLPHCGFDSEKTKHVEDILLQAQKAIDIDGNYGASASLLNSINSELYSCKPLLQANPDLMIITVLIMFFALGIITIIRHYKEKHKNIIANYEIKFHSKSVQEKSLVEKTSESKKSRIKNFFQNINMLRNMQILFLTPLFTTVLHPLVFVFLIPIILIRIPELGLNNFISTFMTFSVPSITILSACSLYYLRHSPINALNRFNEGYYILNYTVMKYAFPIQIGLLVILFSMIRFSTPDTLKITNDEATFLFISFLYFLMAVMISVVFFIAIQFNSQYRFIMAKAKCMLFTKSNNDLFRLKYLLHVIEYYNQFIRANFKMSLNVKTIIVTKFLTDDEFKKEISEKLLSTFDAGETKPLEFFVDKLKINHQDILSTPNIREYFVIWLPIFVGVMSIVATIIQIFLNK